MTSMPFMGPETVGVNSQRFSVPTLSAYNPSSWGPQTNSVPQVSPTMPPFLGGSAGGVAGAGTSSDMANGTNAALAAAHPFNWKVSPVLWAVVGLVVVLVLLQKIHWRKTIISGTERAEAGPARESAEAAA